MKTVADDGSSEIVELKTKTTLNNYSGFTYAVRGLGIATYSVFQKDTTSPNAVVITTSVNDPQNVGFQTEVNKILSTIEILKISPLSLPFSYCHTKETDSMIEGRNYLWEHQSY